MEEVIKALRGKLDARERAMIGYSDETKAAIIRAIETSPVMEEAILSIAELAYIDGADMEEAHGGDGREESVCSGYAPPEGSER